MAGRPCPCPPLQEIPLRSNVYEVYATDKDEGLNGAVRYSFLKTAGNRDWEFFTIDPISGLIQTAQRLDREKQAVYSVRSALGRLPCKNPLWGLSRGVGDCAPGLQTPSPPFSLLSSTPSSSWWPVTWASRCHMRPCSHYRWPWKTLMTMNLSS